ncbi:hypothetical protein RVBP21_1310 [Pseudomonas phage BRkr]|nr:hypothetical protein RVBP21_1310 [Pseudomonas phage BRkr]
MRDVIIVGSGDLGRASALALIGSMALKAIVDIPINETYPQYLTAADEDDLDNVQGHPTCYGWRQCRKMNQRDKAWDIYCFFLTAYKNATTKKMKQKAITEFKRNMRRNGGRHFPTSRMHEYIVSALK